MLADAVLGGPEPELVAATGPNRRTRLRDRLGASWFWLFILMIAVLTLAPIVMLLVTTFRIGTIGNFTGWGFGTWADALDNPRIGTAFWNTVQLSAIRQAIAMVAGVAIAWLIGRTDLPGRRILEFGFWIAVFMPNLTITLSWIFMLDPVNGVVNQLLVKLPFIDEGPFNIFSRPGIIWVHLMGSTLAVKVMLLTPAFRAMDSSLEEAARASGDTAFGALRRINLPVLIPAFLVVLVLGFIRSFEAFEVEQILGTPARVEVLSSMVYNSVRNELPPQYGQATVVSLITVAVMLPAIIFQQRYASRHRIATVSGKYRSDLHRLGRWRWPAFIGVASIVGMMTLVPLFTLVTGTFLKIFGVFYIDEPWTTAHWKAAFDSPSFRSALTNTIRLAVATSLVALVLFTVLAYLIVRTKLRGRGILDFLTWMPSIIPGVVLGLGYLWVFLYTPLLREVYGTVWILVIVTTLACVTLGVQILKTGLAQISRELEEASAASGATLVQTLRRVVVPLLSPTLVVVGLTAFAATASSTSHVALLSTSGNQPLSILQLNQMADSAYGPASVISIFLLVLTVGVALIGRIFGYRHY